MLQKDKRTLLSPSLNKSKNQKKDYLNAPYDDHLRADLIQLRSYKNLINLIILISPPAKVSFINSISE
jgi:hypothetical protein